MGGSTGTEKLYQVVVCRVTKAPRQSNFHLPIRRPYQNDPTLLAFSLGFHSEAAAPGSWLKSSFWTKLSVIFLRFCFHKILFF